MGNAESSTVRIRGRKKRDGSASSSWSSSSSLWLARAAPYAPPPPLPSAALWSDDAAGRSPYPNNNRRHANDNNNDKNNNNNRCSVRVYADMLADILNDPNLSLSVVRRMTLLESMEQAILSSQQQQQQKHNHQSATAAAADLHRTLTDIVAEGILTSPTMHDVEKDVIVRQGLVQQRWDCVFAACHHDHGNAPVVLRVADNPFLNYRKMILRLLRTSRKLQPSSSSSLSSPHHYLPASSWQRLRAMIVQTRDMGQLNDLLERVLERTCPVDTKTRILEDVARHCYHRLLLPDRLDCRETVIHDDDHYVHAGAQNDDGIIRATASEANKKKDHVGDGAAFPSASDHQFFFLDSSVYKRILLLEEQKQQEESCPICLDPVRAPAVQLQCDHVFCGRCIAEWIEPQQQLLQQQSSSRRRQQQHQLRHYHRDRDSEHAKKKQQSSGCPICRRPLMPSSYRQQEEAMANVTTVASH